MKQTAKEKRFFSQLQHEIANHYLDAEQEEFVKYSPTEDGLSKWRNPSKDCTVQEIRDDITICIKTHLTVLIQKDSLGLRRGSRSDLVQDFTFFLIQGC